MKRMGSSCSCIKGPTETRVLMLGLTEAGKTTILYKLKLGEDLHTIPTIGFNVETVQYKGTELTVWDVGGQENIRYSHKVRIVLLLFIHFFFFFHQKNVDCREDQKVCHSNFVFQTLVETLLQKQPDHNLCRGQRGQRAAWNCKGRALEHLGPRGHQRGQHSSLCKQTGRTKKKN